MIRAMLILVSGVAIALLPGDSPAGCHAVAIRKQAVVAYAPVQQPYYWAVAQNLQDDARAERIANLVIQKLQAQQQTAPERLPLTAEVDSHSIIKSRCIGCHGTKAEAIAVLPAEKFLEHLTGGNIEDYQAREKMVRRMLDGTMPPSGPLPGDVLGNALGQIVGAETAPK